jgi:hypothetical protein
LSTTPTTHRAYGKPTDQGSSDVWGVELNSLIDALDTDMDKALTTAGYAEAAGTADVLTAAPDPAFAAYTAGIMLRVLIASDNTTGPTINVKSLGAKDIKARDGSTLTAGALKANDIVLLVYDGTQFLLLSTVTATAAETLAGTDANKAITPAGFAGNKSLVTSGYYKLPGGLIIQWGTTSSIAADDTSTVVNFPTAFSTACVAVIPTSRATGNSSIGGGSLYGWSVIAQSTTSFTLLSDSPVGTYSYIALGY